MSRPRTIDLEKAARHHARNGIQIAIHRVFDAFCVPRRRGPEPHPSGAADEGTNRDHDHPQADKSQTESPHGEAPLLIRVVAVAEWIRVYIGDTHQADDDQRGHDHAGYPGIEID